VSQAQYASAGRPLGGPRSFNPLWPIVAAVLILAVAMPIEAAAQPSPAREPIPVLAYYYIWYGASSWSRGKTDLPLLGRYSSDEREVMRQHVRWAKDAGIEGFIVSWKSTTTLNDRLEKLLEVANEEGFKLGIIYEGLDFEREPLPAARVAADLDSFISRYAEDEAFNLFSKPLVVWSGTWEFSTDEVAEVTQARRDHLLILASEKNAEGYQRLADLVDGDAYYWSSVNPDTFPGYPEKLQAMGEAVHATGGLWIAPAAPGFDARLVGGTTVVERRDGETLRRQMDAAIGSSPDAVGLISWNEFSENSHVEPSRNYGTRYLEVVADILGGVAPAAPDFDSSAPAATGTHYGLPVLVGLGVLILGGLVITVWRGSRRRASNSSSRESGDDSDARVLHVRKR
jgi:hypothetical protein